MSMFGINAHKATRRSISRSPSARRRSSIRAAIEKEFREAENKTDNEEPLLQRHQSCHGTRPTNSNYNDTNSSYKNEPLGTPSTSATDNPPPSSNSVTSPSKALSASSNVRPPSVHHRSPQLQQRYHQTLTQSNSIADRTR